MERYITVTDDEGYLICSIDLQHDEQLVRSGFHVEFSDYPEILEITPDGDSQQRREQQRHIWEPRPDEKVTVRVLGRDT